MKIQDQYTDLPISRQAKWLRRNIKKRDNLALNFRKAHRKELASKTKIWRENHPDKVIKYNLKSKEFIKECQVQLLIILDLDL